MIQITAQTDNQKIHPPALFRFINNMLSGIGFTDIKIQTVDNELLNFDLQKLLDAITDTLSTNMMSCDTKRKRPLAYARLIFSHHCQKIKIPDKEICLILKRNHSTISYYKKEYETKYAYDYEFKFYADKVNQFLNEEK